jgi:hypothetical protein
MRSRSPRYRADASRRRRVAFFILPLGDEPPETAIDVGGRVWHERAEALTGEPGGGETAGGPAEVS